MKIANVILIIFLFSFIFLHGCSTTIVSSSGVANGTNYILKINEPNLNVNSSQYAINLLNPLVLNDTHLHHCSNITGAVSDLCTIVSGNGTGSFNVTNLSQLIDDLDYSDKNVNSSQFSFVLLNVSQLNYKILSYWNNITNRPDELTDFIDDLGNRGYTSLSNFSNDMGYFNNITNFTGYLVNAKYCTYNSTSNKIDCYSDGGSIVYTALSNFTNDMDFINSTYANLTYLKTHLSNFTDNLGNRGYTSLSNFTNDMEFINSSYANSTYVPYNNAINNVNLGNYNLTASSLLFSNAYVRQYIDFNTSYSNGNTEGRVQWNTDDGTLEVGLSGGIVNLQIGQEELIRATNDAGIDVINCQAVYLSGGSGNNPTFKIPSKNNYRQSQATTGLATENILSGQKGYITTHGLVRDCNTNSWSAGTSLYLDMGGNLTSVIPTSPNATTFIGIVIRQHSTEGIIWVKPISIPTLTDLSDVYFPTSSKINTSYLYWNNDTLRWEGKLFPTNLTQFTNDLSFSSVSINYSQYTNISNAQLLNDTSYVDGFHRLVLDPTGIDYLVRASTTMTFNATTRLFNISSAFNYWINGQNCSKPNGDSITLSSENTTHFIYYNSCGNLVDSITAWNFKGIAQVATVNINNDAQYFLGDERHGIDMDWKTHEYIHETIGARYVSGLAGTFDDTTFNISTGEYYDDDNEFLISAKIDRCNVMYRKGSGVSALYNQTQYYYKNATGLYYDNSGTLTLVGTNQFIAMWIFATNDNENKLYCLVGQRTDTTVGNARINNDYASLSLSTLPVPELKLLYRVILKNDATPYEETTDYRVVSSLATGNYVATDHGTLTGLNDDDHFQYFLTDGTRTATGNFNLDSYNLTAGYIFANINWSYIVNKPTHLSNFTDDLGNRGYNSLSNFTDNLGNRGYTSLSNFTNNMDFINSTYGNLTYLKTHLSNFTDNLGNRGYTSLSNFTNNMDFVNSSYVKNIWVNGTWLTINSSYTQQVNISNVYITSDGKVGIGTSTPTVNLEVNGDTKLGSFVEVNNTNKFIVIGSRSSDPAMVTVPTSEQDALVVIKTRNSSTRGAYFFAEYNGSGTSTATVQAINAQSRTHYLATGSLTATGNGGSLRNRHVVQNTGNVTVSKASSISTQITINNGTIKTGNGLNVESPSIDSGFTMDNFNGLYITGGSPSGTITNRTGIYIEALTGGTNKYGIYQAGNDTNYFGGNVGIGTTTPDASLYVNKTDVGFMATFEAGNYSTGDASNYLTMKNRNSAETWRLKVNSNGAFGLVEAGVSERIYFENNTGYVGIGTTTPTSALHVAGNVTISAFYQIGSDPMCWDGSGASLIGDCSSARRFKENITDLDTTTEQFMLLKPREFNWNEDKGGFSDAGFIADEVETATNGLGVRYRLDGNITNDILKNKKLTDKEKEYKVKNNDENIADEYYFASDYRDRTIIAMTVKETQKLINENIELKNRITKLENENKDIIAWICQLDDSLKLCKP